MITIQIKSPSGFLEEVEVVEMFGAFVAVHKDVPTGAGVAIVAAAPRRVRLTVTHIPSGLAISQGLSRIESAAVAEAFDQAIPTEFISSSDRDVLREKIDPAFPDWLKRVTDGVAGRWPETEPGVDRTLASIEAAADNPPKGAG